MGEARSEPIPPFDGSNWIETANKLVKGVNELTESLEVREAETKQAKSTAKRATRASVISSIVSVIAVFTASVVVYLYYHERSVVSCIKDWAVKSSQRTNALVRPGNARVNLLLQAFSEAVGLIPAPLDASARATLIGNLDKARDTKYPGLPTHKQLLKASDFQLLGDTDLLASIKANSVYLEKSRTHPVPKSPQFTCQ